MGRAEAVERIFFLELFFLFLTLVGYIVLLVATVLYLTKNWADVDQTVILWAVLFGLLLGTIVTVRFVLLILLHRGSKQRNVGTLKTWHRIECILVVVLIVWVVVKVLLQPASFVYQIFPMFYVIYKLKVICIVGKLITEIQAEPQLDPSDVTPGEKYVV